MLRIQLLHLAEDREVTLCETQSEVRITYDAIRDDKGETIAVYKDDYWLYQGRQYSDIVIVEERK